MGDKEQGRIRVGVGTIQSIRILLRIWSYGSNQCSLFGKCYGHVGFATNIDTIN